MPGRRLRGQVDMTFPSTYRLARHPRREAETLAGISRVLEPSPPAVDDGRWYADDPFTADDGDWAHWLREHPEHADWTARRWLAGYTPLPEPPPSYPATRLALHRLAVYVLSPARRRVTTKIALRWTLGGVGTPFFGANEQVRIDGATLVRQRGEHALVEPLSTLRRAAAFAFDGGPDLDWATGFDVPPAGDLDAPLEVDEESAALLGNWYGLAYSVLEELRGDLGGPDPDRVQLWPEHFDAAFRCPLGGQVLTFGASPGHAASEQPYLYVLPADLDAVPSLVWNATAFPGAVQPLSDLLSASDHRAAALQFFRTCAAVVLDG